MVDQGSRFEPCSMSGFLAVLSTAGWDLLRSTWILFKGTEGNWKLGRARRNLLEKSTLRATVLGRGVSTAVAHVHAIRHEPLLLELSSLGIGPSLTLHHRFASPPLRF